MYKITLIKSCVGEGDLFGMRKLVGSSNGSCKIIV